MESKAQTSIEFIILISFLLLFFSIFFLVVNENISTKTKEGQNRLVKETAFAIQDEINIASQASDGYLREFKIPYKMGNQDYNITVIEDSVYLMTNDKKYAIALPIPKINGNLIKGTNLIKKQNGQINLNP